MEGLGIAGYEYQGFRIKFDILNKIIRIIDMLGNDIKIHEYFGNDKYMEIVLYDQDGNVKKSVTLTGNDRTDKSLELNNTSFEYGDYLSIYHAEGTGNRYRVEGRVIDGLSQKSNRYLYQITENGLKQFLEYPNIIRMQGLGIVGYEYQGFNIKFDTVNKNIRITDMMGNGIKIHEYFQDNKYMAITLCDQEGNVKKSVTLTGNDRTDKALQFNKTPFEYGNYLVIYHDEGTGNRYRVEGEVIDGLTQKGKEYLYQITENGLKQFLEYPNMIRMEGLGVVGYEYQGFNLKFDTVNKNIRVADMMGHCNTIHEYYNDNKYMGITLYDQDGNVKKSVTLNGNERADKALQFDKTPFEYGDYLEIYHAEGTGNRFNVTGNVIDKINEKSKKYFYKITENGLQQVEQVLGTNF